MQDDASDKSYNVSSADTLTAQKRKFEDNPEPQCSHARVEQPQQEEEDWVQDVVRVLDLAIIVAGAPRREDMIEQLLDVLQRYLEEQHHQTDPRPAKKPKRNVSDAFPTQKKDVPHIRRQISTRSGMSFADFEKHLDTTLPLVIRGAIAHWPALQERPWNSPEYLMEKTFGGRRLVPIEIGRSYTDVGWGQDIVTFKDFMHNYITDRSDKGNGDAAIGYLAQHDLFSQIPSLRADIATPDFCYTNPPAPAPGTPLASMAVTPKREEPHIQAWFGPAGTVSPLHMDHYHNIFCQVVGSKYIRLYGPHETPKLYPKGVEGDGIDMSNTSEVEVEVEANDDETDRRFPLFREAVYVETILSEGECLYIPVGWWHYIRSLTVSFSVSFWWD